MPRAVAAEGRPRFKGTPLKTVDSQCDIMLVNVNAFTSVSRFVPRSVGLKGQAAAVTTAM